MSATNTSQTLYTVASDPMPYHILTQGFARQIRASFSACLILIGCGSSFGWVAPTLDELRLHPFIKMSSSDTSWMIAIIEVGNLISPIPAGLLADRFGRKPLALLTGPVFVISWLIILRFKTFIAWCLGRVLQGLAIGVVFTIVPMYLGEIASQQIRGAITSLFQIAFYLGFLYEYIIGPYVSFESLIVFSIALPLAFLTLFIWQPESPHYYIMRKRKDEAKKSLMWLRGTNNEDDVKEELFEITDTVEREMNNKASWKGIVATPSDRRAMLIVQVVGGVKILSGLPVIISYSTELFRQTGFMAIPPYAMTIVMGSVLFVSGFFSTALTDLTGRRPLLIISTVGCAFSLSFVAVFFYLKQHTSYDLSNYSWAYPASIILYNLFLAFGLDPVSMTYRSEMFPSHTRAIASSISTINFTVGAFATLKLYQIVSDAIGTYFIFALFSLVCWLGSVWIYFYAIETKNRSLSEIQTDLANATKSNH